jgi:hypothetical protein
MQLIQSDVHVAAPTRAMPQLLGQAEGNNGQ